MEYSPEQEYRGFEVQKATSNLRICSGFHCPEIKLAIELDGGYHAQDNKIVSDNLRTIKLNSIGITVLRFWNNDVLSDIEGVVDTIILEVLKRKKIE